MNFLRSLYVIGFCALIVGCGQSAQDQLESVSQNNSSSTSNAEQVRMQPVSINSVESSMYIPSESDSSTSSLSEFALNGGNEFGTTDAAPHSNTFRIDTMNSQPQFQGTGADLSSFDL